MRSILAEVVCPQRSAASKNLLLTISMLFLAGSLHAANLEPGVGYTNDFSSQPVAADWSTRSLGSSSSDFKTPTALSAGVQTNVAFAFTSGCARSNASPPDGSTLAVWSTTGYLQTRPTAVGATLLMATFFNNTGSNATSIHINYDFTVRANATSEEISGVIVYYSLSGAANSWVKISGLSQTSQGTLSVDLSLTGVWTNGTPLYLLWADDNSTTVPDDANDIDNFYIATTGGTANSNSPLVVTLTAPSNSQIFSDGQSVLASATVSGGKAPYAVTFYTNAVGGSRAAIGATGSFPTYTANLGSLAEGSFQIYAQVTDASTTVRSATNTFTKVGAIQVPSGGVTFTFDTAPPVEKWSTFSVGTSVSAIQTVDELDAVVQTNLASAITNPCATSNASPPNASGLAVWSTGGYLQTRPTVVAATFLMASFINNTGSNATGVHIDYDFSIRSYAPVEEISGFRVYYSFTGAPNSWMNIPELSLDTVGKLSVDLAFPGVWTNGSKLYLLWADDNGSGSPDDANGLDNFHLTVIEGGSLPLAVALSAPLNNQSYSEDQPLQASATVSGGTAPYSVTFFTNAVGGSRGGIAATGSFSIYTANLGSLPEGGYEIYAQVTDASNTVKSVTNTFSTLGASKVPVAGVTFTFDTAPPVQKWSTRSIGSGATDITTSAELDAVVQTNIASGITNPCASSSVLPPDAAALAVWSTGGYLQTRPTGVGATLLMATFVNNTGSNASGIHIEYDFTVREPATAEELPGHRVYYSFTGAANTWVNIPELSQTDTGGLSVDLALPGFWTNGTKLYLLWADDNANNYVDDGNGIDNFQLAITGTNFPLAVVLKAPLNGQSYAKDEELVASATLYGGQAPYAMTFYTNALGGPRAAIPATGSFPIFTANLGLLPEGSYQIFAQATDDSGTVYSATNTYSVSTMISGTITRGPYLGSRGESNIVVHWRSGQANIGRVRFGTTPESLTYYADDTVSSTDHVVSIMGLLPETKYYYSLGTTAGTIQASTNYYFFTAPPIGADRSTRLWFISDYGTANSTALAVRNAYQNYISTNGRGPDIWLTGGDNEQSGTTGNDGTYQTTVFNVYSNFFQNVPFFPTPGNHDGGTESAYWSIFDPPQQGECGGYPSGSKHFYSYDYANIHFISIDCVNSGGTAPYADQLRWLTNDLVNNTQQWKIAYWHFPPYCVKGYDSDTDSALMNMREIFNPVLEAFGVDLVMNGHCHVMQRTYLINQHYDLSSTFSPTNIISGGDGHVDGDGAYLKTGKRGTVYINAPAGGGTDHTGDYGTMPCFAEILPYTIKGSLSIDINTNRLDLKVISSTGDIPAYFTIMKGVMTPIMVAGPTIDNGAFSVTYQGTPGATYTIQSKDTLQDTWQDRMDFLVPANGIIPIRDDTASAHRFYRLISR